MCQLDRKCFNSLCLLVQGKSSGYGLVLPEEGASGSLFGSLKNSWSRTKESLKEWKELLVRDVSFFSGYPEKNPD